MIDKRSFGCIDMFMTCMLKLKHKEKSTGDEEYSKKMVKIKNIGNIILFGNLLCWTSL